MSTNPGGPELTAQAEQVLQRRSLEQCAARIADPQLRAQVEGLATGRIPAAEFVQFVDVSPNAWRGLQRSITTYLDMPDEQRTALLDRYAHALATIESELKPKPTPNRRPTRPAVDEEDDTWENESYLE